MRQPAFVSATRREFLRFLAASPYVAALGGVAAFMKEGVFAQDSPAASDIISDPADGSP